MLKAMKHDNVTSIHWLPFMLAFSTACLYCGLIFLKALILPISMNYEIPRAQSHTHISYTFHPYRESAMATW